MTPLTQQGTRFCPGTQGGNEWNGPAYSPQTNFVCVGAVDWCTTGGVITYLVEGAQRVVFVAGTNSPIWPVEKKTAKIVIFGL